MHDDTLTKTPRRGFSRKKRIAWQVLAPAPLGTLVWGRAEVLRRGGRTGFAQCLLRAGDAMVLRASGVFQLDRRADPGYSAAVLFAGP